MSSNSSANKPREEEFPPQKNIPFKGFWKRLLSQSHSTIIINKEYQLHWISARRRLKVGLTNANVPNNVFPAVVARYRDRKALKTLTIVGNDVYRDQSLGKYRH